jgi:hypothetical protein
VRPPSDGRRTATHLALQNNRYEPMTVSG